MRRIKNDAPLPADWEGYWTDFTLLKGRSLSPRTIENYRDTFVLLGRFLGPRPPELAELTRRQLAAFLDHCLTKTSATTVGMRFRGLSAVLSWLAKPGEDDEPFLGHNPLKGLRPPKEEQQPVAVLSQDDVRRVLSVCRGPDCSYVPASELALARRGQLGGGAGNLSVMTVQIPIFNRLQNEASALRLRAAQRRVQEPHRAGSVEAATLDQLIEVAYSDPLRIAPPIADIVERFKDAGPGRLQLEWVKAAIVKASFVGSQRPAASTEPPPRATEPREPKNVIFSTTGEQAIDTDADYQRAVATEQSA